MSLSLWSQWNYVVRLVSRCLLFFFFNVPPCLNQDPVGSRLLSLTSTKGRWGMPSPNGRAEDGPLSPGLYSLGNEMLQMCAAWEKRGVLRGESSRDGGCWRGLPCGRKVKHSRDSGICRLFIYTCYSCGAVSMCQTLLGARDPSTN